MATRSAIGYALHSGKVKAVYCHWDGYPSHQLPILEEHYNTFAKVRALVRPGSMSSLRTEQMWTDYKRDPQPLYHHERGDGEPPRTVANPEKYWRDYGCEHLYVFRPGYGWFHYPL